MEDFVQKLAVYEKGGTPAERRISRYFREHLHDLAFETAASVAERLDLSPMTIGRFLRALGYQGLDGVKLEMRSAVAAPPEPVEISLPQLRAEAAQGKPLAALIAGQIEALNRVYHLTTQPQWQEAVDMMTEAREIFVAAHPGLSDLAGRFCRRLVLARDGVRTLSDGEGRFNELFARPSGNGALLIVLGLRNFDMARHLVRGGRRHGYRVMLITGQEDSWMAEQAHLTLILPRPSAAEYDDVPPLMTLLDCLSGAVIAAAGGEAMERRRRMAEFNAALMRSNHY